MSKLSIVWMRRNLRLEDNKTLCHALNSNEKVLPIFIFDNNILERFNNNDDRRLTFIASTLIDINNSLKKFNGELLVFCGNAQNIITQLVNILKPNALYCDEDFEAINIIRDQSIIEALQNKCEVHLLCDHLLTEPKAILKPDNEPYKVFAPYMKLFRKSIDNNLLKRYDCNFINRLYKVDHSLISSIDAKQVALHHEQEVLTTINRQYKKDKLWKANLGAKLLEEFVADRIENYDHDRNIFYKNGTSSLSPYIRFGLISIRECFRRALDLEDSNGAQKWLSELIWREFYASIFYHFPVTKTQEFQIKYRNVIPWNHDKYVFEQFASAKTGFPIIDAAVTQLITDGWMHNRARIVVASFMTKNLLIDWRVGEQFFAKYLMDYEVASNVGGWQWAASCGTDPLPYFRIFNPFTQGEKFDNSCNYTKKYLPLLEDVPNNKIHNQKSVEANFNGAVKYPSPIVSYDVSRREAIRIFREARSTVIPSSTDKLILL